MKSREIILPFGTIRNIKRPDIVNEVNELHDFIVPLHDEQRNRAHSLFFQINFDFDKAFKSNVAKMVPVAAQAVEDYINEYIRESGRKLYVNDPPHKVFDYNKILNAVFDYYFQTSASIRTVTNEDGSVSPSLYMRLDRGVSIYVSPEVQATHTTRNLVAVGKVNLLGQNLHVYTRRPGLNLLRHVRYETLQDVFSTKLDKEFPYLSSSLPSDLFSQSKIQFFGKPVMEGIV